MTAIHCPRFGNSTVIFPYLVNLGRDGRLCTIFKGNMIRFSAINEDRNEGCCLVHAINVANRSNLSDRCFRDYRLRYKYIDHSDRRLTFAIFESYREICKILSWAEILQLQSASFPNFAAIATLEYCTRWCMSEKEPLEDVVRWFQCGGLLSVMMMPPRVVKLGAPQVR